MRCHEVSLFSPLGDKVCKPYIQNTCLLPRISSVLPPLWQSQLFMSWNLNDEMLCLKSLKSTTTGLSLSFLLEELLCSLILCFTEHNQWRPLLLCPGLWLLGRWRHGTGECEVAEEGEGCLGISQCRPPEAGPRFIAASAPGCQEPNLAWNPIRSTSFNLEVYIIHGVDKPSNICLCEVGNYLFLFWTMRPVWFCVEIN